MTKQKKIDVWMPLYVSDYLADTTHLTTEQHGAYLLLIMTAWKFDAKLPNDPQQLQAITRMSAQKWAASEKILSAFFYVTPEYWIHNRVREEIEIARKNVTAKSAAGKKGNEVRWNGHRKAIANGSQT